MKKKRFQIDTRPDGSPWHFRLHLLKENREISLKPITAVCALILIEKRLVAVKNPRGWDLPGGHVEENESLSDALKRELKEEAGITVLRAKPLAVLESDLEPSRPTYIIIYQVKGDLEKPFTPCHETKERALLSPSEFLEKFAGNKTLMEQIFQLTNPDF